MIKKKILGTLLCGLMLSNLVVVNANAVSEISPLEVKWQSSINGNGNGDDMLTDIVTTNDGGSISVGYFESANIDGIANKGLEDAIIIKHNKDGAQEWVKSFGGNNNDSFLSILKLKDNSFITIGTTSSTDISGITNKGEEDILMVKYDENGNMLWAKTWGGNGREILSNAILTNDGGIAITGFSTSTNIPNITAKGLEDAFIVKFNNNGEEEWVKSFGGNKYDSFANLINTSDNGFIVVGESYSTDLSVITNKGNSDGIIVKYDNNGNQEWVNSFGGNNRDNLFGITETSDNSYIITGFTLSTNIENINSVGSLFAGTILSCDDLGNYKLIKTFNDLMFFKISKTSNNELICLAFDYGNEYGYPMSNIVKLDKDFNEIYCQEPVIINYGFVQYYGMTLKNDNTILLSGVNMGEISNATIAKYVYPVKTLNTTDILDLQVVADNSLEMSLSTNQISFKGYNGVSDLTNNDLNITVTSGLYYDLYATLNDDLRGSNDTGATINKTNLGIKTLEDIDYKNFINIGEPLKIVDNHVNGRNINHNINLKLKGDSSVKADTYSTTITFETIQK